MSITVVSSTDSTEAANATLGDLAQESNAEQSSAPAPQEQGETQAEESDTSEETDSEETLDGEESEQEAKSEDDKPKKKSGFKKRIDKLTSRLSDKEREAEYWKAEALKHQKPQEHQEPKKSEALSADDSKPNPDKFETYEQYLDALTDWKIEQRDKTKEMKAKQESVKTEFDTKVKSHIERVEAFKKSHDDFDDVLEDVDDIPMSLTVQQVILDSDNGHELMYELAKNKEAYAKICAMDPVSAARELGKFEAKIAKSAEPAKETKKTTKAPPPISPVGSKSAGPIKKSIFDPNLSQREYEEMRATQAAKRA